MASYCCAMLLHVLETMAILPNVSMYHIETVPGRAAHQAKSLTRDGPRQGIALTCYHICGPLVVRYSPCSGHELSSWASSSYALPLWGVMAVSEPPAEEAALHPSWIGQSYINGIVTLPVWIPESFYKTAHLASRRPHLDQPLFISGETIHVRQIRAGHVPTQRWLLVNRFCFLCFLMSSSSTPLPCQRERRRSHISAVPRRWSCRLLWTGQLRPLHSLLAA